MITPDIARIEKAKEERRLQLMKWEEYDRNYESTQGTKKRKRRSRTVKFGADLMFLEAAARGDVKEVTELIKSGINPDVANEDGLTALHQCCIDNNLEMCALLLKNGANVNAMDNEDWTPLHAAATCGNKELCEMLIKRNADLLALNVDGNMPYDLCDDNETLILIETEMANRDVTQEQIDEIRLQPEKDMLADLNRRFDDGDDLQALDSQGAAPIHIACSCGFMDVARFLLQHKLNPDLPDQDGWLPIHIAVSWGYLEIVQLLVSYGANMEATTRSGQTVYTLCDSKEFKVKLQEVWDKREELRKSIMQSNPNQNIIRSRGPSLRKNNSSILRTSMRDKHRLTHAEAVREKLLGEKIVSGEGENGLEKPPRPAPQIPSTACRPVAQPKRQILPSLPKPPPNDIASPDLAGVKPSTTRSHIPPSVPPRAPRDTRVNGGGARLNSPQLNNNTTTSTTTSGDTSSPAKSPSESSASPASFVRPMQWNSNGQIVPKVDVLPKSPSGRPPPPTRDNRIRTPKSPVSSPSAPPNPVLRQGPLPVASPEEGSIPPRSDSSFIFNDTPNNGAQRRPFTCCHTM